MTMNKFWNLNDGTTVVPTTEFDTGGGDFEPIPNNTDAIAAIEEAKWDGKNGDDWVSLKWRLLRPDTYTNRVVFQKLKVFGTMNDKDPKATADKAKRMLAAIDANAGGCLMKLDGAPSDEDLMRCLAGKLMAIKVMIWKMTIDGEKKTGNWVSAVSPAKQTAPTQTAPVKPSVLPVQQPPAVPFDDSDDIPF
jgi:hypothetical protein